MNESDKCTSGTERRLIDGRDPPDCWVQCDDCGRWRHESRETCLDCNVWDTDDEPGTDETTESDETEQTKLVTDGGTPVDDTERPDPTEDPNACSVCGVYIGFGGDEYCDGCAREIGAKPPLERCMGCGQEAPQDQMESVDVSAPDEYYPTIRYLCRRCSGGESA